MVHGNFFKVGAYFLLIKIFENKYKSNVGYISMFTFGLLRYPLRMIVIIYFIFPRFLFTANISLRTRIASEIGSIPFQLIFMWALIELSVNVLFLFLIHSLQFVAVVPPSSCTGWRYAGAASSPRVLRSPDGHLLSTSKRVLNTERALCGQTVPRVHTSVRLRQPQQ